MAQPYYPSYSTNTGDAYGYSERAGSTNEVLRSQYAGTYRGEPSFEPARYSAPSPYRGSQQLAPLDYQPQLPAPGSAPSSSRKPTQYRVPTPIAAGAPTPYTGIYSAPLDLSRRDRAKTGNAPAIYARESKQHPPITSLAPKQLWEAEELVDHGASSVYGLGTTRQLTAAVEKAATRDLSASAGRQRRPKTPPLVRPGPTYEKELSARNCGKLSVSRRLPEGERLRYHIPGYMGFVKGSQFHHGGTYGKTTRKCIEDQHPAVGAE